MTRAILIAFSALLLVSGILSITQRSLSRSGNEIARWALIEAIVDHGRTTVEESSFGPTPDTVVLDGRVYSNKPPFLSCWGAAGYWALKKGLGWDLAGQRSRVVYAVTLWMTGLWSLASYGLLLVSGLGPGLALALVFSTTLFSYSGTANNHTPAAFALLAAALAAKRGRPGWCGAGLGLCLLFDPVFAFFFGAALLRHWTRNKTAGSFILGAAPFVCFWLFLNQWMTGFALPLYLYPAGPGVVKGWGNAALIAPRGWDYPFQALLGYRGFFLYSPILLLPLAEWRKLPRARGLDLLLIAASAATVLFHVVFAGGYGGWAFGYRYLIPLVGVFALSLPSLWAAHRPLALILLAVGLPISLLGAYCPWPPSYQGEGIGSPLFDNIRFNAGSNLACFAAEHRWPGEEALARVFIDADPYAALWYKIHFFWVAGKNAQAERQIREGLRRYPNDPALSRRLADDLKR